MIKKILEKLLVFSITLIVCFVLLEIGLRITGRRSFEISQGEYAQHGSSYRLKKNTTKIHNWSTSTFTIYTNSLGARDRAVGEKDMSGKPYVVFLGDSQVFGLGVDYEKTFVGIFTDHAEEKDINVLNLAVGGHFLLEQEEMFRDVLDILPEKPSLVFYTVNASSLNWFDSDHKSIIVKDGYVFYKATWKSAYVKMMLTNNFSTYVFFRDVFWSLYRSWGGGDGKIRLPNHFEWYSRKSKLYDPDSVLLLEDHLDRFHNYCDDLGIRVVYLYVPVADSFTIKERVTRLGQDPDEYDIYLYDRFIEDYCARHGYLCLNPKSLLKEHYDKGEQLDLIRDLHYNEFSNSLVGDYIIEKVFVENELF